MSDGDPSQILTNLASLPKEEEWFEFKVNKADPVEIGQQISGISNSAALVQRDRGFIVWGINDDTHEIVGTTFKPRRTKIGGEELENWLATLLHPRVNFTIHEFECGGKRCVLFDVEAASHHPIAFKGTRWLRVGSYLKRMRDHPQKEKALFEIFRRESFETGLAARDLTAETVITKLDYSVVLPAHRPSCTW